MSSLLARGNTIRALALPCEPNVSEMEQEDQVRGVAVYKGDGCAPASLDLMFIVDSPAEEFIRFR